MDGEVEFLVEVLPALGRGIPRYDDDLIKPSYIDVGALEALEELVALFDETPPRTVREKSVAHVSGDGARVPVAIALRMCTLARL
jgi:hypothetical protein